MQPEVVEDQPCVAVEGIDIPDIRLAVEHLEADTFPGEVADIVAVDTARMPGKPVLAAAVVRNRRVLEVGIDVEGNFAADTFRNCIAAVAVEDIPSYRKVAVEGIPDNLEVAVGTVACGCSRNNCCSRIREWGYRSLIPSVPMMEFQIPIGTVDLRLE